MALFWSPIVLGFNLDIGPLIYGKLSDKPEMHAIHFRLYSADDFKNAKIIYLNNEKCKAVARKVDWTYDSIVKSTLAECNHIPKKVEFLVGDRSLPSAAVFFPDVGPFWLSHRSNGLSYSRHWLKGNRPNLAVRTNDPSLDLCLHGTDVNGEPTKKCSMRAVNLNNAQTLVSRLKDRSSINTTIAAFELGAQDYETSLKELRDLGFPEGKVALDRIRKKEVLCDGKILRRVKIQIDIESKNRSSLNLFGAYHFCPPKT